MLEWLKSAWARWKVQVSMVGGVVVIATAYGTCSFDPQTVSEAGTTPATETATETTTETTAVPVSNTAGDDNNVTTEGSTNETETNATE